MDAISRLPTSASSPDVNTSPELAAMIRFKPARGPAPQESHFLHIGNASSVVTRVTRTNWRAY